ENSATMAADFTAKPAPPLTDVFINIVPGNPINAFAEGNMLQIIFFVIIFAIAMLMTGDIGRQLADSAEKLLEVMMKVVTLVMDFAPVGVFFLMAKTFSEQGISLIIPMIGYFSVVIGCLLLHALGTFSLLIAFLARLNPLVFFKKMRPAHIFAFSTASSNATIPVTLQVVEKRLGVSNSTAAFTIPLGATINMDGTAIMQGVATVFIAQTYNIDLGFTTTTHKRTRITLTRLKLTLFGTDGCHLCEQAGGLAVAVQVRMPGIFEIYGVDIAGNERLTQDYGVRIPVIRDAATGAELDWPFDEATLESFLKALR
ncbi:MAG: cation:dicarboxylase symporter family transporter, partial [Pseudomonadota bacterium]